MTSSLQGGVFSRHASCNWSIFLKDPPSDGLRRVSLFCAMVAADAEDKPSGGSSLSRAIPCAGTMVNCVTSRAGFGPSDDWASSAFIATTTERARRLYKWLVHVGVRMQEDVLENGQPSISVLGVLVSGRRIPYLVSSFLLLDPLPSIMTNR